MGANPFDGCVKLEYNEWENARYLGNKTNPYIVLTSAINENITECNVHDGTKIILNAAFENCNNLENIDMPNGILAIGNSAFSYCTSLTKVEMPDSIIRIGNMAFWQCTNLSDVSVSNNLTPTFPAVRFAV
jgi:hypothetical protein